MGAAYGTAKSGVGIASMGVLKPDLIMKSIIPVVIFIRLGHGGYSRNLRNDSCCNFDLEDKKRRLWLFQGILSLGCRFMLWSVFFGIIIWIKAAGLAIGIVGDAGVRANAQ